MFKINLRKKIRFGLFLLNSFSIFWNCLLIGEGNKAFSLFGAKKCPLNRMSAN